MFYNPDYFPSNMLRRVENVTNITRDIISKFNRVLHNTTNTNYTKETQLNMVMGDPMPTYIMNAEIYTIIMRSIKLFIIVMLVLLIINVTNEVILRLDKDKSIISNYIQSVWTMYKESKQVLPTTLPPSHQKKSKDSPFIGADTMDKTVLPQCSTLDSIEKGKNIMVSYTVPYRRTLSSESFGDHSETRVTIVTVTDTTNGRPPLHSVKI